MIKMVIDLNMDKEYNITISNKNNDKKVIISYSEKKINAIDIYNLLSYDDNALYSIESNIDKISEENEKDYFSEIITLIEGIISEINEINNINEEELEDNKELEEDSNNSKEELDDLEL